MATTQGQAYYSSDSAPVLSSTAITYGFEALTVDDIQVVGINTFANPDTRHPLTRNQHFTVDLETQTVTVYGANSWEELTTFVDNNVDTIRVYRSTTTQALVDFTNGGVLTESELDSSYKQALFACQEVAENASGLADVGPQSITGSMIQDRSITATKLASYTITANEMGYSSVGNTQLINDSVTNSKVANNAIDTDNIVNAAVTYDKVELPTKVQMEAQSGAGIVTPDNLRYSPFSPRCYGSITFDTSAPQIINGSLNVNTSATNMDQGVSERRIYFSTALTDTNYVVMAIRYRDDIAAADNAVVVHEKTTTYFALRTGDPESTDDRIDFVVFGSTLSI